MAALTLVLGDSVPPRNRDRDRREPVQLKRRSKPHDPDTEGDPMSPHTFDVIVIGAGPAGGGLPGRPAGHRNEGAARPGACVRGRGSAFPRLPFPALPSPPPAP